MSEQQKSTQAIASGVRVASSPHLQDTSVTTQRMMIDVLIGLSPVVLAALYFYWYWAALQLVLCIGGCMLTEFIFAKARGREHTLWDCSAVVTGMILALSLPWNTPWFIALIGSGIAMGVGKMIFGGLGMNLFNPAMVGRAFAMLCFAGAIGAGGYVADIDLNPANKTIVEANTEFGGETAADALSGATPLTAAKENGVDVPVESVLASSVYSSLGERGIFVLFGGLFLLIRRTVKWEIPVGAIFTVAVIAGLGDLMGSSASWSVTHQIFGGAFLLGAFFIATDPVTSPVTPKGRWIFGILFGALVMLLRTLSNYPEGVMFSILLVNALVPLLNRWTIPRPFGGPVPE